MNSPALIDVRAAAELLGTSERQIRSMVFERRIPYMKIGPKLRFDPAELEDFLDANHYPALHRPRRSR